MQLHANFCQKAICGFPATITTLERPANKALICRRPEASVRWMDRQQRGNLDNMAHGLAFSRPDLRPAHSDRRQAFRLPGAVLAVIAGLMLAHGALAQDAGGQGGDPAGGPGGTGMADATQPAGEGGGAWGPEDWPLSHMDPGQTARIDEPVGVTVLAPPSDSGAAAITTDQDAPDEAGVDQAAIGQAATSVDGVGLIEAPDGALGGSPDLSTADGDVFADSPTVASFAERSTAQARSRMFGPIGHPPVVVELFTAQGCSSCPPADDMLGDLADRDDVLALSWHVDYWDYLGWADEFARPEFTQRQQAYAHAWRERAIYTPQVIVGGTDTLIALRPAELMTLIDTQMARPAPVLVTSSQKSDGGYQIEITPRAAIPRPVALLLVRYAPRRDVEIKAGENRGVSVSYRNVVLAVDRVGDWDGRTPLRMNVRADSAPADTFPQDTRHAILAQELGRGQGVTGPILAAIRLD